MKIAVIGNCQTTGIANALNASGLAEAEAVDLGIVRAHGLTEHVAAALPNYDWIVVQSLDVYDALPEYAPFKIDNLRSVSPNVVVVPSISFSGFHPDCTAIIDPAAGTVRTPVGEYSSALIGAAFALGLSPERCERLFNAYVYARMGYFNEGQKAKLFLQSYSQDCGMDLSATMAEWFARGHSFMHTYNHPAGFAVEGVAKLAAERMGLPSAAVTLETDNLAVNTIWPTYPEIAERLGVKGSLEFKVAGSDERIGLREMIAGSYDAYSRFPDAVNNTVAVAICRNALAGELVTSY